MPKLPLVGGLVKNNSHQGQICDCTMSSEKAELRRKTSSGLDGSIGSTVVCSEDFLTDDDSSHRPRRPSLLNKVKEKLARSKSDNSFLDIDTSHHKSYQLDLSERLDEDTDLEDTQETLVDGESTSLAEEDKKRDDSTNDDPHQVPDCRMQAPLQKPALHRIKSTPIMSHINPPHRRPSCLKTSHSTTEDTSVKSTRSMASTSSNASSVHFGTISIREYERSISDNPAVTEGPPIGLGWDYEEEKNFPFDVYEEAKPTPRKKEEFLMPSRVREDILLNEWGHTLRDIRDASREAMEVRRRRERAQKSNKAAERVCELMEASKKKWRRLKTGQGESWKQKAFHHATSIDAS